jgi:hypothetical protein
LWDEFENLQSISTTRGLQVANAQGNPIYTIDQTNAASVLPTLNVFSDVLQSVEDAVDAGFIVTIPRDTIVMNQWAGSVWIEQSADGLSSAYLIEGGLFGGSTTQDPQNRKPSKPACSDLSTDFDADSGPYNSDFDRAVAMQESRWTQFKADGSTYTYQNDNGTVDIGIMQVNSSNSGQVEILPDGTKETVNEQQLYNDPQYNIKIGSAILNNDLNAAKNYLTSLGATPTDSDLITEAYYIYNHGSNLPPGFAYSDGTLIPVDYYKGETYFDSKGKKHTVSQGALDAQNNALHVQKIFNNQSWMTGKRGCQ